MKKIIAAAMLAFAVSASAESYVYIFDNYPYAQMDNVTFNGEDVNFPKKELIGQKLGLDNYRKAVTKCVIKNDGRLIIVRDMTWANKPYHDEITFDLADGDVQYIELLSGPKNKIKILSEKDGRKKLEKAQKAKDWTINPDLNYEN